MRRSFNFNRMISISMIFSMVIPAIVIMFCMSDDLAWAESPKKAFTTEFRVDECTFLTSGSNPYFIPLETGSQLTLEGEDAKEEVVVEIEVLDEFKDITLDSDTITTRVVMETEYKDGELVEESWNWFAICEETNSVFYFGEWVINYDDDGTNNEGSWEAGVDGATPGIIMPGTFLLGARYFQEIAEDVAMDRAENIEMDLTVTTKEGDPAFEFHNCVKVFETTPLEPGAKDFKIYAPGIGLIVDGPIKLVDYVIPQPLSQSETAAKPEKFKKRGLAYRQ
jgi:hypothetical protein